jgi:hypothetical protein
MLIVQLSIQQNICRPQLHLLRSSYIFRPPLAIIRDPLFVYSSKAFGAARLFKKQETSVSDCSVCDVELHYIVHPSPR